MHLEETLPQRTCINQPTYWTHSLILWSITTLLLSSGPTLFLMDSEMVTDSTQTFCGFKYTEWQTERRWLSPVCKFYISPPYRDKFTSWYKWILWAQWSKFWLFLSFSCQTSGFVTVNINSSGMQELNFLSTRGRTRSWTWPPIVVKFPHKRRALPECLRCSKFLESQQSVFRQI